MISDYFYDPNKKHTEEQKIEFSQTRLNALREYIESKLFKPVEDIVAPEGTYIPVTISSNPGASMVSEMTVETKSLQWVTSSTKNFMDSSKDRFYINASFFDQFTGEWTQKNKVKLERIDWLYLIYQVVTSPAESHPSFNVGWADGTLGIHMDKPPIMIF